MAADLSSVRIHADDAAARTAENERAHAFALGESITFGRDQLRPGTRRGVDLIAHELAHVLQQRSLGPRVQRRDVGGRTSVDGATEAMDAPASTPGYSPNIIRTQPTLVFREVDLVEDKKQVKSTLVHNFLAQGVGGIQAAREFKRALERETYCDKPSYQIFQSKGSYFAYRILGVVEIGLRELEREDEMFADAFGAEARMVLGVFMDHAKIALRFYRGYFASSGEDNRVYAVAAKELVANSRAWTRDIVRIDRDARGAAWGGGQERADRIREAIPRRTASHDGARDGILSSAPWLQGINYGELQTVATGDFSPVVDVIEAKMKACDAVKTSGSSDVWMNPTIVQATLDRRGVPYDSRSAYAVGWRIHSQHRSSEAWSTAIGVFQMLCYLGAPFTGGLTLIPAAAISLFQVGHEFVEFGRGSDLHQVGLAPAPSSLGLALSIAGAAMDLSAAVAPAGKLATRVMGARKSPLSAGHLPLVEPHPAPTAEAEHATSSNEPAPKHNDATAAEKKPVVEENPVTEQKAVVEEKVASSTEPSPGSVDAKTSPTLHPASDHDKLLNRIDDLMKKLREVETKIEAMPRRGVDARVKVSPAKRSPGDLLLPESRVSSSAPARILSPLEKEAIHLRAELGKATAEFGKGRIVLKIGDRAEDLLRRFLDKLGYDVFNVQYHGNKGIDILARQRTTGRFLAMEVKEKAGQLTRAQRDPMSYVKSRLERAIANDHTTMAAKKAAAEALEALEKGDVTLLKTRVTNYGFSDQTMVIEPWLKQ